MASRIAALRTNAFIYDAVDLGDPPRADYRVLATLPEAGVRIQGHPQTVRPMIETGTVALPASLFQNAIVRIIYRLVTHKTPH